MIRRPAHFFFLLLVASSFLFLLDKTQLFSSAASLLSRSVVRPVVGAGEHSLGSGVNLFTSLFSFRQVVDKLSKTEAERDFYRGEYFSLKALQEENELLRQALQVEDGRQELVLAHVVTVNPLKPNQELTIDKGSDHGIRVGRAVIASGRTLVGIIKEVGRAESTVLLVTSEEARIPVLLGSTSTHAATKGSPTGVLQLDLVPLETPLTEGELVLTSGVGGDVPPQLLVGEIRRIIDDEAASFKRATVKPFLDIGTLRQVFVVTGL